MALKLPRSIQAYFDADRDREPDAVAASFTEDGTLKDKGKTHTGREAIRKWMTEEGKQYGYTVEPFFMANENGKTQVTGHAVGDFPGSPVDLRYFFVLADDKIAELEISV
ncbi:MAG: nuclear transport factor 2 family protein [Devosia sp.]|uniref:nuclear transport factor 2 family protein n=1 Tax=Devosia sp. TaxID=1871048 RepID=UPI00339870A0